MWKSVFLALLSFLCFRLFIHTSHWSEPKTLGFHSSEKPVIGIDSQGNATALWLHFDGSFTRIQSAIRNPEGTWTLTPEFISSDKKNAQNCSLAVSQGGHAFAIWSSSELNGPFVITTSNLPLNASEWSNPVSLTTPLTVSSDLQIAVDNVGNAIAVWAIVDGSDYEIQSSRYLITEDTWNSLSTIHRPLAKDIKLSLDQQGNAVIVWEGQEGTKNVIEGATLAVGASIWVQTAALSPSNADASYASLALDGQGNAIAVWQSGSGPETIVETASLPFGKAAWSNPFTISPSYQTAFNPQIAVDFYGNAVAVWEAITYLNDLNIQATSLNATTLQWSETANLSNDSYQGAVEPEVFMDLQGNATVVWSNGDPGCIEISQLPLGGAWSQPTILSTLGYDSDTPSLAFSDSGSCVLIYEAEDGYFHKLVQVAETSLYESGSIRGSEASSDSKLQETLIVSFVTAHLNAIEESVRGVLESPDGKIFYTPCMGPYGNQKIVIRDPLPGDYQAYFHAVKEIPPKLCYIVGGIDAHLVRQPEKIVQFSPMQSHVQGFTQKQPIIPGTRTLPLAQFNINKNEQTK